jgi:predicted metal-dependent phosphoesterase TrpH
MMTLKFDLHCHSRFSADGVAEPEEMIAEARRKGLSGIAITDHNTCGCVDYFEQKGLINPEGLPVDDFLIIPGQEITTSAGHLLALGVRLPDLKGILPQDAVAVIHKCGGLAIPPHPYDLFRAGLREPILDLLDIDAVEVFNAAISFKKFNRNAYEYAQRRGLPMTASSDAHDSQALGTAYTILDLEKFTLANVMAAIIQGGRLSQHYLSPKAALRKTWNNVFRLRRNKTKSPGSAA